MQHNQKCSYRAISSLHSSGTLEFPGADRKRVVLSVEGWSRLRTQHSSPDLDHWPACTQRDSEQSAGGRAESIWRWGKISDLYLRSPWAAGAGAVSLRHSGVQSSIPLMVGPWGPGSVSKKRYKIYHTASSHGNLFISEEVLVCVCLTASKEAKETYFSPKDWTHRFSGWEPWQAERWTACPRSVL